MTTSATRNERIEASRTWQSAFGCAYGRACAATLVEILTSMPSSTLRDLFRHVGEGAYDLEDDVCVDVLVGELVGQPGAGPTVASLVEGLSVLDHADLAVALDRPLVAFVDGSAR